MSFANALDQRTLLLHKGQAEVYRHPCRFKVVTAGRRWGKCLKSGTLVEMWDGSVKPIEAINAGDRIVTVNEFTNRLEPNFVQQTAYNGYRETIRIETNYREIVGTPNHPMLVNGRWTELRDVRCGDFLWTLRGSETGFERDPIHCLNFEEIVACAPSQKEETHDLQVTNNRNFIANGAVSHNSQLSKVSLIKIAASGPRRKCWYVAPSYRMAKTIMWDELIDSIPREWISKVHHTDLSVRLINGSMIECKGADSPDTLRGVGLFYVVLDEVQDMKKDVWEKVLRPTLARDRGKALFIGCITGNSKVMPMTGMKPIQEYCTNNQPKTLEPLDEPLFGINNKFHTADGFWNNGVCETKKIRTQFGFGLEASHRHPILVMGDDGEYEWRRSDELAIGDRVAIARGMEIWGNKDPLIGWSKHIAQLRTEKESNYVRGPRARRVDIDSMTDDLAYFLGLWLAEGSYEEDVGRLTITCGDPSVGKFLMSGSVAGMKFSPVKNRSDQWRLNSFEMIELMKFLNMPLVKAPEKWIPDWVAQGRREWACELIAGMWDGDGYVCDPEKKSDAGYVSASERLSSDLQLLLSNIGVMARRTVVVTQPTKRAAVASTGHRLVIYSRNLSRFRDNISLRIARKKANLDLQNVGDKTRRDGLPSQQNALARLRFDAISAGYSAPTGDFSHNGKAVSYDKISALLKKYPLANGAAYQELSSKLNDFYFWDEIKSIEDGYAQTYDFTIPETHSFWSNGFISHNTPKGYQLLYDFHMLGQKAENREWMSWQFPTSSSPFIPEAEIIAAKNDMDEKSYRQEFEASFETMSGRVYYPFNRHLHVSDHCTFNPDYPIWVGQDFNVDPMCSIILQPQPNGEIWAVDEIFQPNSSSEHICAELEKRYWRYVSQTTIYPDPAGGNRSSSRGESDLDIFREKEFRRIKHRRKHPFIADRVNAVNRMLMDATGKIRFRFNPKCLHAIASLEQTLYKPGSRDVDKGPGVEHMADAIGYPIELEFPTRKIVIAGMSR